MGPVIDKWITRRDGPTSRLHAAPPGKNRPGDAGEPGTPLVIETDHSKREDWILMREAATGKLEVHRSSTPFAKYRAYPVFVDGEKVGSVKDGASIVIPLPTGKHQVWCKIDWEKSNILNLDIDTSATTKISVAYKKKIGFKFFEPAAISLIGVIAGSILGIQIMTVIGVVVFFLTKIGDLHIEAN